MDNESIEEAKRQLIFNIRETIEEYVKENFVECYKDWQAKLSSVNAVIAHVDPDILPYTYNEFCTKIIEITKNSLNSEVDYNKLFLTSSEYFKIMNEYSGNETKIEKAIFEKLNHKFIKNLMLVLNKNQLKESIKHKLKDKFIFIEKDLDISLELSRLLLNKLEEYDENDK